jgi:RNase P/RNase MRP subunit p29
MRDARNLGKHELIGLNVRVLKAGAVELEGRVTDETMNTFEITDRSKSRTVPKTGRNFVFDLDGKDVTLEGDRIRYRPEDRTKKVR